MCALAAVAHRRGVPLVADTTMIPFTEFDGQALGIDVEVVSSTKYVSGGATSLGGVVIDYGIFRDSPSASPTKRFSIWEPT